MYTTRVLSLPVAAVLIQAVLRAQGQPGPLGIHDLVRFASENNRELTALRNRLPEREACCDKPGFGLPQR